jgi:ribosome maturation factor RimP
MDISSNQTTPQLVGKTPSPVVGRVWRLAEPLCNGEGMELVHVAYQREPGGRILRLIIDKPGGVSLDDCVNISRQLSDILDVDLDVEQSYRMEVSSPGQKRPLSKRSDFNRFTGYRAKVRTARAIKGQKNFTGNIEATSAQSIRLVTDSQPVTIMFNDIVNAHLIHDNGENACSSPTSNAL